jgi:hypothetical protein
MHTGFQELLHRNYCHYVISSLFIPFLPSERFFRATILSEQGRVSTFVRNRQAEILYQSLE